MPKYTLPPRTPPKDDDMMMPQTAGGTELDWQRRLTIPANKDIAGAFSVDDEATITLTGKITGINSRENQDGGSTTVELDVSSVEAYPVEEKDMSDMMPSEYRRHREAGMGE